MKGDCSFVEIGGIVDRHYSNFISIKTKNKHEKTAFLYILEFKSKVVKNKRSLKRIQLINDIIKFK